MSSSRESTRESSSASSLTEAAAPPQIKAKSRACDPCRLRRVKCERVEGQSDCLKCHALKIKCIESVPKTRTTQKGARIAQAKRLYGDRDSNDATPTATGLDEASANYSTDNVIVKRFRFDDSRLPFAAELKLATFEEANMLLSQLVAIGSDMKIARLPLLRWFDISTELNAVDRQVLRAEPLTQSLFFAVAAITARATSLEHFVGQEAPTLREVSQNRALRQDASLCAFGSKRHALANNFLALATRKINENAVFATPDLRSVVALCLAEMLILVYKYPTAWTKQAIKEARPYSSAAASHLRCIAEDPEYVQQHIWQFKSVAWTAIIRDSLVAATTGRPLDFTSHDLVTILSIDETRGVPWPTARSVVDSWVQGHHEGPRFMQLWANVLLESRRFVKEISQPAAIAKPRLNLAYFERFHSSFRAAREILQETSQLMTESYPDQPQAQMQIMEYSMDFMITQAHRLILWRAQAEQVSRAEASIIDPSDQTNYRTNLQALRCKSEEEVFRAARRVMQQMESLFSSYTAEAAEYFIPGYFVFEGILIWASVLVDMKCAEDGGRVDYPLSKKIGHLSILREALAVTGWSDGGVLPNLTILDGIIGELVLKQVSINNSPSTDILGHPLQISPLKGSSTTLAPSLSEGPPSPGNAMANSEQFSSLANFSNTNYMTADSDVPISMSTISNDPLATSLFMEPLPPFSWSPVHAETSMNIFNITPEWIAELLET